MFSPQQPGPAIQKDGIGKDVKYNKETSTSDWECDRKRPGMQNDWRKVATTPSVAMNHLRPPQRDEPRRNQQGRGS